jgi:predicted RNA-binding protein with PUA-like domain
MCTKPVPVSFVTKLPHYVSLHRMRADPALSNMVVLRAGRLSVQPVSEDEYRRVVALGDIAPPPGADKPANALWQKEDFLCDT